MKPPAVAAWFQRVCISFAFQQQGRTTYSIARHATRGAWQFPFQRLTGSEARQGEQKPACQYG